VDDERSEQIRPDGREAQDDDAAEGIADDMRWLAGHVLDDGGEIGDVVSHAALFWESRAPTVSATVVRDHAQRP
jgi:hypothetical protein